MGAQNQTAGCLSLTDEVHLIGVDLRRPRNRREEQRIELRNVPFARAEIGQSAVGDGQRIEIEVLQNEVLAPMTTTSSSSRSSGALDDSTRAMARLVTVSLGSGMVSTISAVQSTPCRFHYMIRAEWLLNQCMPGHPYPDLTGLPVMKGQESAVPNKSTEPL